MSQALYKLVQRSRVMGDSPMYANLLNSPDFVEMEAWAVHPTCDTPA
jgi:hypothetical protein